MKATSVESGMIFHRDEVYLASEIRLVPGIISL